MNIQKIRLIKKYHTIISFIIFCSTLIYGIFKINLPITSEALSRFGTYKETNFIWISSLLLIITSICINSTTISEWNLKYKKLTRLLFNIAIFGLFNVAFINMDHNKTLHNIYNEMTKYDLIPVEYEGDIKTFLISNKTGEGIKELLEHIEELKKDNNFSMDI
jgi:hypothetical protein